MINKSGEMHVIEIDSQILSILFILSKNIPFPSRNPFRSFLMSESVQDRFQTRDELVSFIEQQATSAVEKAVQASPKVERLMWRVAECW